MKLAHEIIQWGKVKPFFDKEYKFNTIDIETIDNELFIFGYTLNGKYKYTLNDFYNSLHNLIIESCRDRRDILTWSRYDNTHLIKLIIGKASNVKDVLNRIGKVSPVYQYKYNGFDITIDNVIKDSIIFTINDGENKPRRVTLYNLKNLFQTDLEKTAKNYKIDYYSKLGIEYHIIDKKRFTSDLDYKNMVIKSNELDNKVLIDIANIMLNSFKEITGQVPKTIFTTGSIARSYLLAHKGNMGASNLQFKTMFKSNKNFDKLLEYSMLAYHGGKIESYVLGYIKKAKIIDITSAYPYAMTRLPKPLNKTLVSTDKNEVKNFFYAFIKCDVTIHDKDFIHPLIIPSPLNPTNISPYGYIKDIVITKIEYDYLIKNNIDVNVKEFIGVYSEKDVFPFRDLVNKLFKERLEYKEINPSRSEMNKTILNSLYGINHELTDVYMESGKSIVWVGYRAGDYFNSVISSYITAMIRTQLSGTSNNIVKSGGKVFLNMTDSIIYEGDVNPNIVNKNKILGMYEEPKEIKDVYILGAGRYEFKNEFNDKFTIKNRGFSVSVKDKGFYNQLDLNGEIVLDHKTFVTAFKATTNKYGFDKMGHLIKDTYEIDPFNLGGKRFIDNKNVNLNTEYTTTSPVYLDKDF